MYESMLRSAADPWFPPEGATWHRGDRHRCLSHARLCIREALCDGKQGIASIGPLLRKWLSDARVLREAWDFLAARGGTSPGPNGRRYDDLDDPEVWELLRTIGGAIRKDTYRVGGERQVAVPKDRSDRARGTRPISLLDIQDRVVQRATVEILQPLLDPLFGHNVLGFRPGRNRLHALALLMREASSAGRYVCLVEDIKDAFLHVPLSSLMDVLAVHIPSEEVLTLIRRLLDRGTKHGLRQGGPLSPLLLNIYVHHFLDEPWRRQGRNLPMIRVADDILVPCRTPKQAKEAWDRLHALLEPAGMDLKHGRDAAIHDLRKGGSLEWLGFEIRKGKKGLTAGIAPKAWSRLAEYLSLAHTKPDSAMRAVGTIDGWIEQMAPCYRTVERPQIFKRLEDLAAGQGFDEIPARDAMTAHWQRAYKRWLAICDDVRERPEALDSIWALCPSPVASAAKS